MPGLASTRSRSLYGLSHLRNQFDYGIDYDKARQEVINRLQAAQGLPTGVTPLISPFTPTGEIFRYTLKTPRNALGQEVYTLNDIKALQDWTLQREFRRVPRIADVVGAGGTVKRYEIHPDPNRLKRHGITLQQLQDVIARSNGNVGGDYLPQGRTVQVIRSLAVLGGGEDPIEFACTLKSPGEAAAFLRSEEEQRLRGIRQIVIASVNNVPVKVDDVVEGGPVLSTGAPGRQGVVVGSQTRLGKVSVSMPSETPGGPWTDWPEKVQGIVLLRKDKESLPALEAV